MVMKGRLDVLYRALDGFVDGPMNGFRDFVQGQYQPGAFLSRQEIENSDGELVRLTRALGNAGLRPIFWEPGPTQADIDTLVGNCNPDTGCTSSEIPGYDEVDYSIDLFKEIAAAIDYVNDPNQDQIWDYRDRDQQHSDSDNWVSMFYDPNDNADYYDRLGALINGGGDIRGMNSWKTELENKKMLLPTCEKDPETGEWIVAPPCKFLKSDGTWGGTIDQDVTTDEFAPVKAHIQTIIDEITAFQADCISVYDEMNATTNSAFSSMLTGLLGDLLTAIMPDGPWGQIAGLIEYGLMPEDGGGVNPTKYTWRDSRGRHEIVVRVMLPMSFPRVKKEETGNWLKGMLCFKLVNYRGLVAVDITRRDPANVEIRPGRFALGRLNPTDNPEDEKVGLRRTSVAYYSYNWISMVGKGNILNIATGLSDAINNFINGFQDWFSGGG